MKERKQIKISLTAVLITIIILVSFIIVAICAYINLTRDESFNETTKNIIGTVEKESQPYSEVDGFCRVIGNDSNLLYKNEYESDTSYSEKIIYLDEAFKARMTSSMLNVEKVLYVGAFEGEFIKIKYDTDSSDYTMSLAYIEQGGFYHCTTNKTVKKAFDKNGNEIDVPKYNYAMSIPTDNSIVYALFDITTNEGENYIVGMYDKAFSDSNMLLLTVVLKKENAQIDIDNKEQVKEFWDKYASYEIEEVDENSKGDYEKVDINGKTYYHRLSENTWGGKYQRDTYYISIGNSVNIQEVVSYSDYLKYINEINSKANEKKVSRYYKNKKSNYIILSYANGSSWCKMEIIDCVEENNKIIIYGDEDIDGSMASGSGYFIAIPTNMPVGTKIEYRECYSTSEISNLKNYGTSQTKKTSIDKPIIYLYPTEETEVYVNLGYPSKITTSYPKYGEGWRVLAKTSGNLIDLTTNKKLYALYYESEAIVSFKVEKDGFIVKGEEVAEFLEEKLLTLGLTEIEAEEFIIYWLPKLQENEYNYIRFATIDEINENMPLEIKPNPDTIIRVLMTYKGLDNPIEVEEQELVTPNRKGFVAVEWGGTEIK